MAVEIKFQNVVKAFGATRAIDGVSLSIAPGELFFLLGPSGCGKTTLLRSVAGFVALDEGRILFDGEDISALAPHERDTGMMFQSYALWPHMTVAQNVAFGLEMRKVSRTEIKRRVAEALAMVRMEALSDRKPNQLSGGQQQRVALARALVIKPRCLLLDEPLSNLDTKLRVEMRSEIRRICKEAQLTSIYVTHDQKEALSVADRMAIMKDGTIMQTGTPLEIYRKPNSMFTASFIGEVNVVESKVAQAFLPVRTGKNACATLLCVRPEAIRLDDPPQGAHVFDGVLLDTVYLGEIAQHLFDVNGTTVKVFELNPKRMIQRGATARLWVAREDVIEGTEGTTIN